MQPKYRSTHIACIGVLLSLLASSCRPKVAPFADTLEQDVRNTLDLSKFDISKLDDHLQIVVASGNGRRSYGRNEIEKFIEIARQKGIKYETSDFKVLSKDESGNSRFASISYGVTWKVVADDATRSTHVVAREIWERQIDGWHRLAAAMDATIAPGNPVTAAAQVISASSDQTGQHPGVVPITGPSKVMCATATSDIPNRQPAPSCQIMAPGFSGDVKPGGVIGATGAGTVTLTCNGHGNRLTCTARVQ